MIAQGRVWLAPPTRAIWIPHGLEHEIDIKGEAALRTLYISSQRVRDMKRGVESLEITALLRELIVHIVSVGMLDPQRNDHDRLAGVLIDLISAARPVDLMLPLPRDLRAQKLAERLRSEPSEKQTLESLAATGGASLRTLQRCFVDETGLTIDAWRQKARLIYSAAALAEGSNVTDAALKCGYESPSAYISAFRTQFGVTPGRFCSPVVADESEHGPFLMQPSLDNS